MTMKKRIAIAAVLCMAIIAAAGVFTACGEKQAFVPPHYDYYSFTYYESLGGLVLDVTHSGLLPDGALSLPASSYYYDGEEAHDEPKDVVAIADGAFDGCGRITSVTLPSAYKHIGAEAFKGSGITELVLNNDNVTIADRAFFDCVKLEKVSGGKVSAVGSEAFFGCVYLRAFDSDTSGATIAEGAFDHTKTDIS